MIPKYRKTPQAIAEFATKHGVKEAVTAYKLSPATVYRYLKVYNLNSNLPIKSVDIIDLDKVHKLTIQINYFSEYRDNTGYYRQIYQLTAIDTLNSSKFIAFSSDNNRTVVEIFKGYLNYCYQKAGIELATIVCSYYKDTFSGYNTEVTKIGKKRAKDSLLEEYVCANPNLKVCEELLPVALASQILNNSNNGEESLLVYPIIVSCAFLKKLIIFEEQNDAWNDTVNANYCQELLKKTLAFLEQRATAFYKQANSNESIFIYSQILKYHDWHLVFPKFTVRVLIHQAKIYNQKKEYKQALSNLAQAQDILPHNPEIYYQQSIVLQDLQQKEQAQKSLLTAKDLYKQLRDFKSQARYYECSGMNYYFYQQDYANALRNFRKMKIKANAARDKILIYEAVGFMANICYLNRNYKSALTAYHDNEANAVVLDDENLKAIVYYSLAITYKQIMNYDKALLYLQKGLEVAQKYDNWDYLTDIHLETGDILLTKNDPKKAMQHFNYALKLLHKFKIVNQNTIRANYYIGSVYQRLENFSKAIKYYRECIKLSNTINETKFMINYYAQIANIYKIKGQHDLSIKYFLLVLKMINNDSSKQRIWAFACFYLAELYQSLEKFDEAKCYLEKSRNHFMSLYAKSQLHDYKKMLDRIRKQSWLL